MRRALKPYAGSTSWDMSYCDIAFIFAKRSTCMSKQVGAVIVKNDRIISHGYNGTPPGAPHCREVGVEQGWIIKREPTGLRQDGIRPAYSLTDRVSHSQWSEHNEIHAEQNAICYAARAGLSTEGSTMYVTLSPCHNCCKLIVAAGIKTVVVSDVYDRAPENWSEWLTKNNVEVINLEKVY